MTPGADKRTWETGMVYLVSGIGIGDLTLRMMEWIGACMRSVSLTTLELRGRRCRSS